MFVRSLKFVIMFDYVSAYICICICMRVYNNINNFQLESSLVCFTKSNLVGLFYAEVTLTIIVDNYI